MAGTVTWIMWGLSHSEGSQQGHPHSCRQDRGVFSADMYASLIFYIVSKSFSLVMQYYQKDLPGCGDLRCPLRGIQSEERAVASTVTHV